MKKPLALGIILMLLIVLISCGGDQPAAVIEPSSAGTEASGTEPPAESESGTQAPVEPTAQVTSPADDPGLNLLVSALGNVLLKRKSWLDYYAADFGSELHRGDLIRVDSSGNALVLCDGLTTWEVPAGAPAGLNNGCPPPPEAILVRGESLVGNTRAGNDPLIPYVLSPRKTKLLNATPMLRWNPSPDATSYTVSVRGQGLNWSETTDATELAYPGEPPLAPGQTYALIIEADNGKSSQDEGIPGLGFTLLDAGSADKVRSGMDKIKALNLSDEAEALALSQFMVGQGLNSEAIELLESVIGSGIQASNVYRQLGDLYRAGGLALMADVRYATAVELADSTGNLESASAARAGWAEVQITLGNQEQAIALLEEAIAGYETLGDMAQVEILQARLAAISG